MVPLLQMGLYTLQGAFHVPRAQNRTKLVSAWYCYVFAITDRPAHCTPALLQWVHCLRRTTRKHKHLWQPLVWVPSKAAATYLVHSSLLHAPLGSRMQCHLQLQHPFVTTHAGHESVQTATSDCSCRLHPAGRTSPWGNGAVLLPHGLAVSRGTQMRGRRASVSHVCARGACGAALLAACHSIWEDAVR